MTTTLSVIVPAFNEAQNLSGAVEGILRAIGDRLSDYEVIIVNDGSRDNTGLLAEELAKQNPHIRVIHHPVNQGLGASFRTGINASRLDYLMWVPGDNDVDPESIKEILEQVGKAEIIIPYHSHDSRPWLRRRLSRLWTLLLNFLFGFRLKYYNGLCVYKNAILKEVVIDTNSFGFLSATLITALKQGHSYQEIPFRHQGRRHGKSSAYRLKNILATLKTIAKLYWRLR